MEYFMARRPRRNHSNDFKAKLGSVENYRELIKLAHN